VSWPQILFGALLVAALLGVAGYYSWRQVQALRLLRQAPNLPADEARYSRYQIARRLVGCILMVVLAGLLAGVMIYLEGPAQQLAEERGAAHAAGQDPDFTPEEKNFVRLWGGLWIAILLVLLAVVLLAGYELWAVRRYGLREHRKIQADRRAMIARQVARLRQERNGHT
jgi:hypothetical protein